MKNKLKIITEDGQIFNNDDQTVKNPTLRIVKSKRFPHLNNILKDVLENNLTVTGTEPINQFFECFDNGEIKGLSFTKNRHHIYRGYNVDHERIKRAVKKMDETNDTSELKPLIIVNMGNGWKLLINGNHTVGMVHLLGRTEHQVCELDFYKDLDGRMSCLLEIAKAANTNFVETDDFSIESLRGQYLNEYDKECDIWSTIYDGRTDENIEQHKEDFISDNQTFFSDKGAKSVIAAWIQRYTEEGCFYRETVRQWDDPGKRLYAGELKSELDDNHNLVRNGWAVLEPRTLNSAFNTGTSMALNLMGHESNPQYKSILPVYCRDGGHVRILVNDDEKINNMIKMTRRITRNLNSLTKHSHDVFGLKLHFMPYADDDNLEAMARVNELNRRVETPESEW